MCYNFCMPEFAREKLSNDFRFSKAKNSEGEVFFNFNNSFEKGLQDQIVLSAKISPTGNVEMNMSALPLDFAALPLLAENYIMGKGKKPIRETVNHQTYIKSEDGAIEFIADQQTTVDTRPVYVKIKLPPPQPENDLITRLSHIVAVIKSIPESDAEAMLRMLDQERNQQAKVA
jgi:hypothetical protein